jgi:hypothetical protein
MPFAGGSASTQVTVAGYEVKLEQLPAYVVAGGEVSFEGTLTVDGKPARGETVKVKYCPEETPESCYDLLTLATGAMGEFYTIWRPPHSMACKRYYFYAEHEASGAKSTKQLMAVAYPVKVTIKAPERVNKNVEFTVEGRLMFEYEKDMWRPLQWRTVSIYCNDRKVADVKTLSDGSYSVKMSIQTGGTYTLRAVFKGEKLTTPPPGATALLYPGVSEYTISAICVALTLVPIALPILLSIT